MLERIEAVLPACLGNDVRIVTNMGAANPRAGARAIRQLARDMGAGDLSCAMVTGDDVSDLVRTMPALQLLETGAPLESILPRMASANAYLGADVIAGPWRPGARDRDHRPGFRSVAVPRTRDARVRVELRRLAADWPRASLPAISSSAPRRSTAAASPIPERRKSRTWPRSAIPSAISAADGSVTIGKLDINGGRVDVATCNEQLLYEIHDPASYITPDCVLDITGVRARAGRRRIASR